MDNFTLNSCISHKNDHFTCGIIITEEEKRKSSVGVWDVVVERKKASLTPPQIIIKRHAVSRVAPITDNKGSTVLAMRRV